jgi:hypothetical protein
MIVYKLVSVDGNKFKSSNYSFLVEQERKINTVLYMSKKSKYILEYIIDIKTEAITGTKILCFENLEYIRDFLNMKNKNLYTILKCYAPPNSTKAYSRRPHQTIFYIMASNFKKYWRNINSKDIEFPLGTIFCDYVIPLKEIKIPSRW